MKTENNLDGVSVQRGFKETGKRMYILFRIRNEIDNSRVANEESDEI